MTGTSAVAGDEKARALAHLRAAVGNEEATFHDGQWEAIEAVVARRSRALVVQRTGWGKSIVYFIATRLLRDRGAGPTVIVSPLLALMRNQIAAGERLGLRPVTINSTNRNVWGLLRAKILEDGADVLLVSPERLANDEFVEEVLQPIANRIGLLVVDEAHCISDWGHDFRPDYRRLQNVLTKLPEGVPLLCTTATASDRVVQDVTDLLGGIQVVRGSLMRESLRLQAIRLEDQPARLAWLAERIPDLPGSGIVYVLTKRDADQVTGWLRLNGIEAEAYYSDLAGPDGMDGNGWREELERRLLANHLKVLVATSALGMGFDKPDVGFVIHYQAPGSIVQYYQMVGRAGRGIPEAFGVLLSGREDEDIQEYFRKAAFPTEDEVREVLAALGATDGMTVAELTAVVNLPRRRLEHTLKYLSVERVAPVIKVESTWRRTGVRYFLDVEKIAQLTVVREREWREMQEYVTTRDCKMQFLARALDDTTTEACGRCASCAGGPILDEQVDQELAVDAARFLRRSDLVLGLRAQIPRDSLLEYGLSGRLGTAGLTPEVGRVLCRWGDAGWGWMVREDKGRGQFRPELIRAVADLVRDRWKPMPAPGWVTCIPSLRHPDLVPRFARELAEALRLPFIPAVRKVRETSPQKAQQNSFHQAKNLDGAFAIEGAVPAEPVLLVDDVVDSGWTLTIGAALLRRAGSGPVFPLALASSGPLA